MDELIFNVLSGLPTAASVMYIWIVSERNHAKEREMWRAEITGINTALNAVTQQVSQLTYIIENYVLNNGKTSGGK